jgi:hypothetical protein
MHDPIIKIPYTDDRGETLAVLGPLEKANLNHWTRDTTK